MNKSLKWISAFLSVSVFIYACQSTKELTSIHPTISNRVSAPVDFKGTWGPLSEKGQKIRNFGIQSEQQCETSFFNIPTPTAECSYLYQLKENGNVIYTLSNPTAGSYPTLYACTCGEFHLEASVTISGGACPKTGVFAIGSRTVIKPCPSPTPSPEPTATPPIQTDTCEVLQALFSSQLSTSINTAQNMLQPISNPAPMNQNLGDWQNLMKKLKDNQAKIVAEQAKAKPNQNKISQLQGEITQAQLESTQLQNLIENRVTQMDSARPALRSTLNSVAQQPAFSQDTYADQQAHPLPQTLEGYRMAVANLVNLFESQIASTNTHELMAAINTLANEQELYGHLVRDILSEKLPLTPEEPDEAPTDEALEQMNTSRKLVNWLTKQLGIHVAKLAEQQQYLHQFTEGPLQALNISPSEFNQAYYEQINQETFDSLDSTKASIEDLDLWLNQGSFTIQGEGAGQVDPTRARAQMQKQLAKISQRMQNIENGVLSYASDLHEFASRNPAPSKEELKFLVNTRERQIHSEFEILELEKERLLQMAAQYQSELGEEGGQKVKDVDDKIKETKARVLNQWLHNVRLAHCILQKDCQKAPPKKPEGTEKQKNLLDCSQGTIDSLDNLINNINQQQHPELKNNLQNLKALIEKSRHQMEAKIAQGVSAKGVQGQLYGQTAEGIVALKLSSGTTPLQNESLHKAGIKVKDEITGKDRVEIDFMTGYTISGIPNNVNYIEKIFTMGEIKTGSKGQYKDNSSNKFRYAKEKNADRFIYLLDTNQIDQKLKNDLKIIAVNSGFNGFNPDRDIIKLREFAPEINACGQ